MIRLFKILVVVIFVSSCRNSSPNQGVPADTFGSVVHAKVLMAAFQQKAAEYKALCYQAYNVARWQLDSFLLKATDKPRAIMTDVDETVLNNSPYQVHQSFQGKDFEIQSWRQWTARADADTIPGALAFFKYAASQQVEIFYVTNRGEDEREATLTNLKKFGFPNVDDKHLLLMGSSSSKVPRRESLQASYNLIMQIGDNLNDLDGDFQKKSTAERSHTADRLQNAFGKSLIVLPNPSYGEWENALYNYKSNLSSAQKDSVFKAILQNY